MRTGVIVFLFLTATVSALGQDKKPNNWSVGVGAGWFHYINTLDLAADLAETNHWGYTLRFMWEPEHKLAMGIESGYYTVYSIERGPTPSGAGGSAKLTAIPILLSFRVRMLPNLFLSGGPGMTIMYSDVTVQNSTANSSFLSLANFHVSAMYRKRITDHFEIGGEMKFLNFGKTEDYGYSLQLVGAYRFRFKK